jgi:hypothetical protein
VSTKGGERRQHLIERVVGVPPAGIGHHEDAGLTEPFVLKSHDHGTLPLGKHRAIDRKADEGDDRGLVSAHFGPQA